MRLRMCSILRVLVIIGAMAVFFNASAQFATGHNFLAVGSYVTPNDEVLLINYYSPEVFVHDNAGVGLFRKLLQTNASVSSSNYSIYGGSDLLLVDNTFNGGPTYFISYDVSTNSFSWVSSITTSTNFLSKLAGVKGSGGNYVIAAWTGANLFEIYTLDNTGNLVRADSLVVPLITIPSISMDLLYDNTNDVYWLLYTKAGDTIAVIKLSNTFSVLGSWYIQGGSFGDRLKAALLNSNEIVITASTISGLGDSYIGKFDVSGASPTPVWEVNLSAFGIGNSVYVSDVDVLSDGNIVIGVISGGATMQPPEVCKIDASTGNIIWKVSLYDNIYASSAYIFVDEFSDGSILATCLDANLFYSFSYKLSPNGGPNACQGPNDSYYVGQGGTSATSAVSSPSNVLSMIGVQVTSNTGAIGNTSYTANTNDGILNYTSFNTYISAVIETTEPTCNGSSDGEIVAKNFSNGTRPYQFQWYDANFNPIAGATDSILSNVSSGFYKLVVRDANGCASLRDIYLPEPSPILGGYTSSNVTCFGANDGYIQMHVGGGVPPYTVNLIDANTNNIVQTVSNLPAYQPYTFSNLSPGTYDLEVVDAKGCTVIIGSSIVITEPAPLSVNASTTNPTGCSTNDGAISVTVSGGTPPYSYQWSNGATTASISGLDGGRYVLTVTDANGCQIVETYTLTEPGVAHSATEAVTTVTCPGGSDGAVDITVSPAGSYTYEWYDASGTVVGNVEDISNVPAGIYTYMVHDAAGCTYSDTVLVKEPDPFNPNPNITGVSCYGGDDGAIDITMTGGTGPYTYSWSGPNGFSSTNEDISNLVAGTYTLTVTDANGCTFSQDITVGQPTSPLNVQYFAVNPSTCGASNGFIDVFVSGGTYPHSIQWSDDPSVTSFTRNNLSAGVYEALVADFNGCEVLVTIILSDPSISVSGTVTDATCAGAADGSITLGIIGGTPNLTFSWTGPGGFTASTQDINGIDTGTYIVTVTDANGCTAGASFTVGEANPLAITGTVTDVSCNGGSDGVVNITVSGGFGTYTFDWQDASNNSIATTEDVSGLAAGTYTVYVADGGCNASASFTINEPDPIAISGVTTDASCNGGSDGAVDITVTGGTPTYSFSWEDASNNVISTTEDVSGLAPGQYTVTVTDANGCTQTATFTINEPDPITVTEQITDVSCAGGSDGEISVTVSGGTPDYSYSWQDANNNTYLPLADGSLVGIPAGEYTLTVTDANGCTHTAGPYTVSEPAPLSVTIRLNANVPAVIAEATGGTPPYTYEWANGETGDSIGISGSFAMSVTVTDANGCTATAAITNAQNPVKTGGCVLTADKGQYLVGCQFKIDYAEIMTIDGKVLHRLTPSTTLVQIPLPQVPNLYILKVRSGDEIYMWKLLR